MQGQVRPILEIVDLKTYFFTKRGVVKAVDGVSFSLKEGETLGIVGESGCGKSVTAHSVVRLLPEPPARIVGGKVLFEGEDLLRKSQKEMTKLRGKRISMILQDPTASLDPVFTVGTQLAETFVLDHEYKGDECRGKVIEMLRNLDISSPETRISNYPHELSGGMRQRVVGGIALSRQPHLIIADEPTTNLDVTIQAQYLRLLKRLQAEYRLSMLFITHDFGIVARICDRVVVMYAGKIVEAADTRELFNNPLHPYTAALMNSLPKVSQKVERLASIPGQIPNPLKLPAGCYFAPRCSRAIEKCATEQPPQVAASDGHYASCWRVGQ